MKRITILSAILMFGSFELIGMDAGMSSAGPGWGGGPGPWGQRMQRKTHPKFSITCDQAAADFELPIQNAELKMLAAKIAAKSCKGVSSDIFGAAMGRLCSVAFGGVDDRVAYDAKQAVVNVNQTAVVKETKKIQQTQRREAWRSMSPEDAQDRMAQRRAAGPEERSARLASIEENLVQKSYKICEPYLSPVSAEGDEDY